jgi:WD40 repeat protein
LRRFADLPAEGACVAWSRDSLLLAIGGNFRELFVYGAESGELRHKLVGHDGPVRSVAFSNDGKSLYSGSDDGTVRGWSMISGQPDAIFQGHFDRVRTIVVHPNLPVLISSSYDLSTRLWRIDSN